MEDLVGALKGGPLDALTKEDAEAASNKATTPVVCNSCSAFLEHVMVDLGSSPLANSYLEPEDLRGPEPFYPLCIYVCERCLLVQLPEVESASNIFSDYAYFSSYSDSWLDHAKRYVAQATERFGLGKDSLVVEIASNDGYLLQYFSERSIPVLGIEPAANVAEVARDKGIRTISEFFGLSLATRLIAQGDVPTQGADLVVSNNVLAHVPDLNDFVAGFPEILADDGVWTIEVPHLLRLIEESQFDTMYHEHFSYYSLYALETVFTRHGLAVFDIEEVPTHGGSLRLFVHHQHDTTHEVTPAVEKIRANERRAGLLELATYAAFSEKVQKVKRDLLRFLIDKRERGETVVGYGAPAKGNTLLNYCGVRTDLLAYTVDRSPHKQGRFLPGTRIPIEAPERLFETKPDWVLILPWNIEAEIREKMAGISDWGGRFVVAIPELRTD